MGGAYSTRVFRPVMLRAHLLQTPLEYLEGSFCRWRRHEFSTRFGDQYLRLVKTFALTCSFFDRRFTWNDRLLTSAGIPSAKFWLGIFDSCHFRQSHWSVQYLGGVFDIHNGWMQAFPSLLSPLPLASFFAPSAFFARLKLVRYFPFAWNAQERLLRRLTFRLSG